MKYGIRAKGPALGPVRSFSDIMKIIREAVEDPVSECCSRLFLVQKVSGGCRPVINLSSHIRFVTSLISRRRWYSWFWDPLGRGCNVLKDTYFQILIPLDF